MGKKSQLFNVVHLGLYIHLSNAFGIALDSCSSAKLLGPFVVPVRVSYFSHWQLSQNVTGSIALHQVQHISESCTLSDTCPEHSSVSEAASSSADSAVITEDTTETETGGDCSAPLNWLAVGDNQK